MIAQHVISYAKQLNAMRMNMFDMDDIMTKHSKTRNLKLDRFVLENALQDIK